MLLIYYLIMYFLLGDIKKDKTIIQYARKPGLAHNQRWKYEDGYIFPASAPNLVLDVRGGELKDAASIFLNTKIPGSATQQWLIQPFEDARSKQDLILLRPPPCKYFFLAFYFYIFVFVWEADKRANRRFYF